MPRKARKEAARILVISDNAVFLERLKNRLETQRGQCMVVETAAEARRVAPKLRPHLILVEVNSPLLRSIPIIKELRSAAETRSIPLVGLCGHLEPDRGLAALEAGCVGTASHAESLSRLGHLIQEFTGNTRVRV